MKRGFSLLELLLVVAIIAITAGMALSVPRADQRRIAVEAAARDLAGTLRHARSLAMERRSVYAVAFNIANAPGTSGTVLNNWSGGHWYQIIGPGTTSGSRNWPAYSHPIPLINITNNLGIGTIVGQIGKSWSGERRVLPARKVRFLALSDQDNGHVQVWSRADAPDNRTFPTSYPRPWCGWWEASTGRLYPWGGYDARRSGGVPVIKDTKNRNPTGFYFEGIDGAIPDCRNPGNRICTGNGSILLEQGAARPLVNADWLDSYISFRPDGTVAFGRFGTLRSESYGNKGNAATGGSNASWGDLGDLTSSFSWSWATNIIDDDTQQASHFQSRTGWWYLTLAPDMEVDSDIFPSALEAARSMLPACRVAISAFGEVRVVAVKPSLPDGAALDTWIAPADWGNYLVTTGTAARYQRNLMSNTDGSARGAPVTDAITPEMLANRMWWLAP